jgi:hypothetical protein
MSSTVIPASDVRPRAGTQSGNLGELHIFWVPDIRYREFRDDNAS